ncbi:outer membrane lipoprotein SlyB [Lebetimonas natsushimae]|uniref:Outer membrane lipoprotein SlyB n=1 Tax=Lebetimonas natsushimae TaxID=1936991 RepID=A0A292YC26_9BACT|nr:glycine zipper 2TM domain-containing protein [Lebetimonas natsushimae]GAX87053.1 outer membrane lipoprotein SlyB [Lebetimonas natsushimae]
MKKIIFAILALFLFSGCTQMYNSNEVDLYQTNGIYTYEKGKITDVRYVRIRDDGSGTMIGALVGTVLGSMFGNGKGNVLTTLAGGLTGAYVGNQVDKANGEELYIHLDDGRDIVTIVKGVNFGIGEMVRVVFNGNKILRVEHY